MLSSIKLSDGSKLCVSVEGIVNVWYDVLAFQKAIPVLVPFDIT